MKVYSGLLAFHLNFIPACRQFDRLRLPGPDTSETRMSGEGANSIAKLTSALVVLYSMSATDSTVLR